MHAYGHEGRHAWEPAYISEDWREWGSTMTEKSGPGAGSRGRCCFPNANRETDVPAAWSEVLV